MKVLLEIDYKKKIILMMNKKKNPIYLTTIPDFTRTVKKINFH